MSDAWALRAFRWSYVAFIAWASVKAFVGAFTEHPPAELSPHSLAALAGIEVLAALLFCIEPLEAPACALLLAVYTVAAAVSIAHGEAPLRFVYYAATAVYIIMAHRAAPRRQAAAG